MKTLREFDHHFTAPQFGFESYEEYYKKACIAPDIDKFSIPIVGLNAIDDPMQPGEGTTCLPICLPNYLVILILIQDSPSLTVYVSADLPIKQATADSSKLALIVTSRGGHLGKLTEMHSS